MVRHFGDFLGVAVGALLALSAVPRPANAITDIAVGGSHSCAVTSAGGVKCWGRNNSGQLGDGTTVDHPTPEDVCNTGSGIDCSAGSALTGVVSVSVGRFHTCAITTDGKLKCWGRNTSGQLGDGTNSDRLNPVTVPGLTNVAQVSNGASHTCALIGTSVQCWGLNNNGQLGDGTLTNRVNPRDVCADAACTSSLSGIAHLAAGANHTCAVTSGGAVKCWGSNTASQLGPAACANPPAACGTTCCVPGAGAFADVTAVAAGLSHTCSLHGGGGVLCWGSNLSGQLGVGDGPPGANPCCDEFCSNACCVAEGCQLAAQRCASARAVCSSEDESDNSCFSLGNYA